MVPGSPGDALVVVSDRDSLRLDARDANVTAGEPPAGNGRIRVDVDRSRVYQVGRKKCFCK